MFSKRFMLFSAFCAALVIFSGCAEPVVFSEVFQLQKGQEIYTSYNIWYDDPQEISALNIQNGAFIPIGTAIDPIGTEYFSEKIRFRVKNTGQEFAINFDDAYRLCTMRDYIAATFTTENPLKNIPAETKRDQLVAERIRRGEVVPGMTRKEVELAYGPPPAIRTPDKRNETWIYWRTPSQVVRVIFRDDVVRNVFNAENAL